MGKATLFKKAVKDISQSLPQFLSICVMAALSVSVVMGLDSMWKTIDDRSRELYAATNLSDIWVSIANPTEMDMWRIRNIEGVEKAEKRLAVNSSANINGRPTLLVYTTSDKNTLDRPYLIKGSAGSSSGAILDETFAKHHNLRIGDKLELELNDRKISLRIEALALSSEHVFSVKDTTSIMPDPGKYGFVIVDEDKVKGAYGGRKPYNQICIRLAEGANESEILEKVDAALGDDLLGIITRNDNRSVSHVASEIKQFKVISAVFPIMFFLVTALVTLSTMSRLVEEQREQIGILKALGYGKRSIVLHYSSYGVYVGLLGAALGALIGPIVIGRTLIDQMRFLLVLSDYRMSINVSNLILSTVLIVMCTGGISCYTCLRRLEEAPAALLREKLPRKGNRVFIERIPGIWGAMNSTSRLVARNTFRNRWRMLMSIVGIAGCTGLVIGAFSLNDMMLNVSRLTYEDVYAYDNKIVLDDKTSENDIHNLALSGTVQSVQETVVQVVSPGGKRRMTIVTIFSPESPLVNLRNMDGNIIKLPKDGVAITRKQAELLGVGEGDTLKIKRADESYTEVEIGEVIYMVSGQGIYMSDYFWEMTGEEFVPNQLLVKWDQKDQSFLDGDYVESYVEREAQKSDFDANLQIVFTASVMLIAFGGMLAFVVLYNLSVLNFCERIRDIATMKVLGFQQKEVRPLVLAENVVSSLLGIAGGVPVGMMISFLLARDFGDDLDLVSRISAFDFLMAAAITMLFTVFVNRVVSGKMRTIDMLEALKSIE
ncbi:ABC-type antimicrobial peptide transport system, permease component (plasmid) [Peptoclostridium acidaminophilum DSM 3953]|uniref:ABC-type antimicrobial peptide transport system, permease component n=1 Tax=Peptoclostridium acidaminophilum DSM 3953 TaxID=1286171 RepID=W8UBS8_PEPAC|nr:ABC transporter permease [Peptoclostridium acidaminophilum]AHM58171.1 ABC-type antimicrobial peptide transport system, permease component [Peptoclostridium acidaminophilum DSM 3953]